MCPTSFVFHTAARQQIRLHRLNSEIFTIPFYGRTSCKVNVDQNPFSSMNCLVAHPLMKLILQTFPNLIDIERPLLQDLEITESLLESLETPKSSLLTIRSPWEIYFLGTGAAVPSKYRNVSSILLRLGSSPSSYLMLDCGEGTYGTLFRRFGMEQRDQILSQLRAIWISHIHADHHLGLIRILTEHRKLQSNTDKIPCTLLIIGPSFLLRWLLDYSANVERLYFQFVDSANLTEINSELQRHLSLFLGLSQFLAVPVIHCQQSYALVMQFSMFKLVYSGDTRPCEELVEAGKNCTVLIHEATFEDSLLSEALIKSHSTIREAIEIGIRMNAFRIILSHFSQRYPKIPHFDSEYYERVILAFDLMTLRHEHLEISSKLLSSLYLLLAEEEEKQQLLEMDEVDLEEMKDDDF